MSGTRLLWLAAGSRDVHTQALYSLYSALAFRGAADTTLHVHTDAPDTFGVLGDQVSVHALTPDRQRVWRGPAGLPYRMKVALLVEVMRTVPSDRIFFVDADTFFFRDYAPLLARVDQRNAVMHIREWHVPTAPTGQLRRFRRNLQRLRFRNAPIDLNVDMWNSGVIGALGSHVPIFEEALEFMDSVWSRYRKGFVEQFAVSAFVRNAGIDLHPADDFIFHYWFQKPAYQQTIAARLARWRELPLDRALHELRQARLVLPPNPPKRSLWEKLRERLTGKPIPDIRGLPKP